MFLYQSTHRHFAVAAGGLEEILAAELESLGSTDCSPTRHGVYFVAPPEVLVRVVDRSRVAGRILVPLESFTCHSERYLRRRVQQLPWEQLMQVDETLAVSVTLANSRLNHSQYVAQITKDAVCDRFRDREGRRPSVDRRAADLRIHVHVQADKATVSVDAGAGARHRRGYRTKSGEAPLQETLAAALLDVAGYDGTQPLLDPMCGSGTLLAEAAWKATGAPVWTGEGPPGCVRLPSIGPELWDRERIEAERDTREAPTAPISGCELDAEVLGIARENLARVPGGEEVRLRRGDFREHGGLQGGLVVCNPPYGLRLGSRGEAAERMRALGDFLKQRCHDSVAWLVLGDRELAKHVGLRASRRMPVRIGGLDGRFVRFDLY